MNILSAFSQIIAIFILRLTIINHTYCNKKEEQQQLRMMKTIKNLSPAVNVENVSWD
jgi:hypothetical protein